VKLSRVVKDIFTKLRKMAHRRQRSDEPLLIETNKRFTLHPIQYPDIWAKYKEAEASMWNVSEIDLGTDMVDWKKLSDDERHFIKHVLAFFASSDGIVMENLAQRFMNDVKIPEARHFYALQQAVEAVHSETYSLLIETYVEDKAEKAMLFNAIEEVPCVKAKAEWAMQWINSEDISFAHRLIAFACVEGIFFSGSFCAIFWLKKRGLMPGLAQSNEYISRDEGLHTQFAALLYSKLQNKLRPVEVCRIVGAAVAIEKKFVTEALPVRLIGMNADLMCQYIEFVANHLIESLGLKPMYYKSYVKRTQSETGLDYEDFPEDTDIDGPYDLIGDVKVQNPFDFMDMISLQGKTNFFEKHAADYQKAGVMASKDGEQSRTFSLDEDF